MADPFSEKYFNFEINCIGTLLAAKRKSKEDFEFLSPSQLKEVLRFCSLPRAPIDSMAPNQKYWVAEVIPFSILGLKEPPNSILANFYKCGHKCQVPHYLSMAQIDLPAPSFHCPKFFQKVHFMNL